MLIHCIMSYKEIIIISTIISRVSIISITISIISILISVVGKISIIIHGSAPLNKQELLGMPTMYKKPSCKLSES